MPNELKEAVSIGVIITENVKSFVDSPITDVLTTIIPGDLDDRLKLALRKALPELLIQLKLAENCANLTDSTAVTQCAINQLQNLNGNIKSAFLHNLSILLAQVAADGKLTWKDGATILEWYYQKQYKAAP